MFWVGQYVSSVQKWPELQKTGFDLHLTKNHNKPTKDPSMQTLGEIRPLGAELRHLPTRVRTLCSPPFVFIHISFYLKVLLK